MRALKPENELSLNVECAGKRVSRSASGALWAHRLSDVPGSGSGDERASSDLCGTCRRSKRRRACCKHGLGWTRQQAVAAPHALVCERLTSVHLPERRAPRARDGLRAAARRHEHSDVGTRRGSPPHSAVRAWAASIGALRRRGYRKVHLQCTGYEQDDPSVALTHTHMPVQGWVLS